MRWKNADYAYDRMIARKWSRGNEKIEVMLPKLSFIAVTFRAACLAIFFQNFWALQIMFPYPWIVIRIIMFPSYKIFPLPFYDCMSYNFFYLKARFVLFLWCGIFRSRGLRICRFSWGACHDTSWQLCSNNITFELTCTFFKNRQLFLT